MAPRFATARLGRVLLLAAAAAFVVASNAHALRVVDWSLQDHPLDGVGTINDSLRPGARG